MLRQSLVAMTAAASGPFAALFPYLPATSSGFVAGASSTDTQATADPIIDEGLPASFALPTPVVPRSQKKAAAMMPVMSLPATTVVRSQSRVPSDSAWSVGISKARTSRS